MSENPFSWLPQPEAREAFQNQEDMEKEAARNRREVARLFYDVFAQGRGPELLDYMQACTTDLDLMNVSGVLGAREIGVTPSDWAYHRNGQNSVVRWILENLQTARLLETEETNNV